MTQPMKHRTPTLLAAVAVVALLAAACAGYTARLATITVMPDARLAANSSQQFTAEGRDTRGALFDIKPIWSVVANGGTIDEHGLFVAGSTPGTFLNTVTATDGNIVGSANVTVTPPAAPVLHPLASITVTPAGPDTIPASATRQFLAEGKDSAGTIVSFSPTWSVVAGGGSISTAGLFTAGTVPGIYANTIKASSGTIAGFTTLTVASSAASLSTMAELVHFAYDKSDLTDSSRASLDSKVKVFQANPAMRILIVGNTDSRGTGAYNLALGTRRAESVRDYLVAQGVASSRIQLETRGETQPIASGNSAGAMAQNRRDAFLIVVDADSVKATLKQ
ncbi:MAG TPA: OmpA family protein [Gemmatimonadales bacterium]|nr:OmpA family protein [Gemmatimonadales bacterium]